MKKASMTSINSGILEEMLRLEKILKGLVFADADFVMDSTVTIYEEIRKTMGYDQAWEYLHANIACISDLAQKKLEKSIAEKYIEMAPTTSNREAVKTWSCYLAFYLVNDLDTEAPVNINLDTNIQEEIIYDLTVELGLE